MADKYNKPRRQHVTSGNGIKSSKYERVGQGGFSKTTALTNEDDTISDSHKRVRLVAQIICAILLCVIVIYLFGVDNEQHHHFSNNGNAYANGNGNENIDSNLVSLSEIGQIKYVNTARIRNVISSSIIRQSVANTVHDVHIVFSSGCSEYQNWQSEVLLYSWARLSHPGQITRIVSGCKSEQERISALKSGIISERVHLYFTRDFTPDNKGKHNPFHYFNKPYSMKEWLFDKQVDIAESIIILIDPDMIITRIFDITKDDLSYIKEGYPMSQKYGIGPKWIDWGVCQGGGDCNGKITESQAWEYYSVGPPYMMHINDWRKMIDKWVELSPAALEKDPPPSILAEMYSFAMASAYYKLRHKLIHSMLSDPDTTSDDEPWNSIDWDWNNGNEAMNPKEPNYVFNENQARIIHYCHGYWLGNDRASGHLTNFGFNFHKGHLPKDILHNCDIPLLVEPPTNELAKKRDSTQSKHHVWMLYQVITRINSALANYKHLYCPNWTPSFKTVLVQPEFDAKHRMHYFLDHL